MDPINPLAGVAGQISSPFAVAPFSGLGGALTRLGCSASSPTGAPVSVVPSAFDSTMQTLLLLLAQLLANGGNTATAGSGGGAQQSAAAPVGGAGSSAGGASGGASAPSSAPVSSGPASSSGYVSPLDNYKVTSGFGGRSSPTTGKADNHGGLDMAAASGTSIKAAKAGTVSVSRDDSGGYGKWVEIKHADGGKTRYAHMSARVAQPGQQVQAGQEIGKVGSTGNSTGPHLHFEVIKPDGSKVDPRTVLS